MERKNKQNYSVDKDNDNGTYFDDHNNYYNDDSGAK